MMEPSRRRQHRSCDQCRKGKRACDAAVLWDPGHNRTGTGRLGIDVSTLSTCSNCKRWRKECTFHWLSSVQAKPKEYRRQKSKSRATPRRELDLPLASGSHEAAATTSMPWPTDSPPSGTSSLDADQFLAQGWKASDFLDRVESVVPEIPAWGGVAENPMSSGDAALMDLTPEDINGMLDQHGDLVELIPRSFEENDFTEQTNHSSDLGTSIHHSSFPKLSTHEHHDKPLLPARQYRTQTPPWPRHPRPKGTQYLTSASQRLAVDFARSSLTENFLRIYHDSMENALSCWLTERNCPYSGIVGRPNSSKSNVIQNTIASEWGPNWSNRISARIYRLDRAWATVRGRQLTAAEDKAASQALKAAIMAFATQWTPYGKGRRASDISQSFEETANAETAKGGSLPSPLNGSDRSVQEALWNQARKALSDSTEIPSFRIIFANIIFSLTQRPLNIAEQIRAMDSKRGKGYGSHKASDFVQLHELFDSDSASNFLDTALRQLFSYRFKLTRYLRQMPSGSESDPIQGGMNGPTSASSSSRRDHGEENAKALKSEDHETFNLLFWLGVMFDTLTAAMLQRPPTVSDEDSELPCTEPAKRSPSTPIGSDVDLDGMNFMTGRTGKKYMELWGDLFLHQNGTGQKRNVTRWPCSWEEAAETLSNAAPVKVLLFRRVGRLQTLVYRGAAPERIEEAIEDAFQVYQQWNCTYGQFMLDCVADHDNLPPRIQSWYVILEAHWHLGAILLGDTLESIDRAQLGLEDRQNLRLEANLISALRHENAVAVSEIAQCSMHGKDPLLAWAREFHDAVNDGAFLTEPWTAVLIQSLARSGYILLDEARTPYRSPQHTLLQQEDPVKDIRRRCRLCIDALWFLGRKSDTSFLAARALSEGLDETIQEQSCQGSSIIVPDYFVSI